MACLLAPNLSLICLSLSSIDIAMDATRMNFRDNSFDVSIDKGTYDALAVSIRNHGAFIIDFDICSAGLNLSKRSVG
jgi:hypothetical protein